VEKAFRPEEFLYASPSMENVVCMVEKVKDYDTTALVTGESGTGKELVARMLHYAGRRKAKPFVAINCGAIPETLLESELFGHRKGAFTEAKSDRSGLIEEANGYRQRVIAYAEGEASRFRQILTEYNRAPAVTRERMYLETVQQIMTSTSKIMIDAKSGGNLLFLPLDKIMQMSAAGASEAMASAKPSPTDVPTPETSGRSRDSLRARDRESRQ